MAEQFAAANEPGGGFPPLSFQDIHSKYYKKQGITPSYELMVQILQCTSDELNAARRDIWPELRKPTEKAVTEGEPRQRIYELAFNSSNNMYLAGAIDVLMAKRFFSRNTYCNTVIRDWLAYALATKEANDMKKNTNMQTAETDHLVEMTNHVNKLDRNDPHQKSPNKERKKPFARCSISVRDASGVLQHIPVVEIGAPGGDSTIQDITLIALRRQIRTAFGFPANRALHVRRIEAAGVDEADPAAAISTPLRSDDELRAELEILYEQDARNMVLDMRLGAAPGRSRG